MSQDSAVESFEQYPFSSDPEFQAGLSTIIASASDTDDINALEDRAKLFYFNRKSGLDLQPETILEWRQRQQAEEIDQPQNVAHPVPPPAPVPVADHLQPSNSDAPYPPSFARLAELISTNQAHLIPNNDIIPDKLNEAPPSETTQPVKAKPWEVKETEEKRALDGDGANGP